MIVVTLNYNLLKHYNTTFLQFFNLIALPDYNYFFTTLIFLCILIFANMKDGSFIIINTVYFFAIAYNLENILISNSFHHYKTNLNLLNGLFNIHPFFIYNFTSYITLFCVYFFYYHLNFNKHRYWGIAHNNNFYFYINFSGGILLGIWWAYQEIN